MNLSIIYNHPCNFSAEVTPSATLADQAIVPAASPCQRQEIALKQVSYLISQTSYYRHSILSNLSSSFSKSKTPQIAYSPLLSTSLTMKAKKQAPLRQRTQELRTEAFYSPQGMS